MEFIQPREVNIFLSWQDDLSVLSTSKLTKQEKETVSLETIEQSKSEAQKSVPMFKMSLCVEPGTVEDSEDQNNHPEDEMEESHTHEIFETDEKGNSIFSWYSKMSFRKFKGEYPFIFVLISFLMFFISGLFFGAILVKLYFCDKGNFNLKDLNGTITLSEQFDMILFFNVLKT